MYFCDIDAVLFGCETNLCQVRQTKEASDNTVHNQPQLIDPQKSDIIFSNKINAFMGQKKKLLRRQEVTLSLKNSLHVKRILHVKNLCGMLGEKGSTLT